MGAEKKLKAFIVSFSYHEAHSESNDVLVRSVVLVAYDKEEAGTLFVTWVKAKGFYERVDGVVVQKLQKTRKNKHFFTEDFYNRQNNFIEDLKVLHCKA